MGTVVGGAGGQSSSFLLQFLPLPGFHRQALAGAVVVTQRARERGKPLENRNSQVATSDKGKRSTGHSNTEKQVMQTMWSHLVVISLMIMATSASVVMTRVERVCPGSNQCLPFSSCTMLQGRNKQDTLQAIRQLQCGFSGSSPMVCCPPSLPRKAVTSNDNPAININVNSRTNLDIGGLNARSGNFPASQEETTLWSEEFGPK